MGFAEGATRNFREARAELQYCKLDLVLGAPCISEQVVICEHRGFGRFSVAVGTNTLVDTVGCSLCHEVGALASVLG